MKIYGMDSDKQMIDRFCREVKMVGLRRVLRQGFTDCAGNDAIFEFKNRVLVHFAVDLTNVYMTTCLQGTKTYFLPFNQGSNGAGDVHYYHNLTEISCYL